MEDVDEVSEHSLLEFSARATLFCVACLQYWLKIFKSMHHSCFWALGATKLGPGKKNRVLIVVMFGTNKEKIALIESVDGART